MLAKTVVRKASCKDKNVLKASCKDKIACKISCKDKNVLMVSCKYKNVCKARQVARIIIFASKLWVPSLHNIISMYFW